MGLKTRQLNPISAYLFIMVRKLLFISVRNDNNIEGIDTLENNYLYSADGSLLIKRRKCFGAQSFGKNADFFSEQLSVEELLRTTKKFSSIFSHLKLGIFVN